MGKRWGAALVGALMVMAVAQVEGRAATQTDFMVVDGHVRTYRVYRPAGLGASTPVPLVVMLHGGFGSANQAENTYGWDPQADADGFVAAFPNGIGAAWNAGTCCGFPMRQNIDDVKFIAEMIERLVVEQNIDRRRIYATGMSNGAFMAYRLACERPGLLAAIGPVAGTMVVPCTTPTPLPTSVMHIHGLADQNVPYEGGAGTKGFANDSRPSVPASVDRWRQIDGCAAPVTTVAGPVTTYASDGCNAGTGVTLITVDGAGHQWPGSAPPNHGAALALGLDQPSDALDATATLAAFFLAHPQP